MEKSERKLNKREDKNRAVEKWLNEGQSEKNTSKHSHIVKHIKENDHRTEKVNDSVDVKDATDKSSLVDDMDRLELHGQHIRLECPRECISVLSETETELLSFKNVLPKVYLTKRDTKACKHVQFNDQVEKDEEIAQLQRNMTDFLAMRDIKRDKLKQKKSSRSIRYVVSPSKSDIIPETTCEHKGFALEGGTNEPSIEAVQPNSSRQNTTMFDDIPSILSYCKQPMRLYKRLGIRSCGKPTTKNLTVNSRCSPARGNREQNNKTPVIRGLVVDSVDNQKPSIVRASLNANIREEFALKQKVASYRHDCHNQISTINHAQRRLGANLAYLRKRLKSVHFHSTRTDNTSTSEERSNILVGNKTNPGPSSDSVELFIQSKGYVPAITMPSRAYSFPALIYPKRKTLTVKQCA